jgi:hypothetical protein
MSERPHGFEEEMSFMENGNNVVLPKLVKLMPTGDRNKVLKFFFSIKANAKKTGHFDDYYTWLNKLMVSKKEYTNLSKYIDGNSDLQGIMATTDKGQSLNEEFEDYVTRVNRTKGGKTRKSRKNKKRRGTRRR